MAWSNAARAAALEARRRKFTKDPYTGRSVALTVGGDLKQMQSLRRQVLKLRRYSLSPSGRLNDSGSFKPHTLKGANVAEARVRNTRLMKLRNQRRVR